VIKGRASRLISKIEGPIGKEGPLLIATKEAHHVLISKLEALIGKDFTRKASEA